MKTAASVEKEVREKTGAGLVRVGGEIRNPFGCKDFLVDKEVPRAGTAVAREDRVGRVGHDLGLAAVFQVDRPAEHRDTRRRSEEHTSELQSRLHLVCRLLLEKKIIN